MSGLSKQKCARLWPRLSFVFWLFFFCVHWISSFKRKLDINLFVGFISWSLFLAFVFAFALFVLWLAVRLLAFCSSFGFLFVFCFLFLCSCVSFALSVVLRSNKAGRLREIAWLCGRIRVHCTSSDGAFTATCSCINFRYIDQIDHLIASI